MHCRNQIMQNKLVLLLSSNLPSETHPRRITSVVEANIFNRVFSDLSFGLCSLSCLLKRSYCWQQSPRYTLRSGSVLFEAPLITHVSPCCREDHRQTGRRQNILFCQIFAYSPKISSDHFFRWFLISIIGLWQGYKHTF